MLVWGSDSEVCWCGGSDSEVCWCGGVIVSVGVVIVR